MWKSPYTEREKEEERAQSLSANSSILLICHLKGETITLREQMREPRYEREMKEL